MVSNAFEEAKSQGYSAEEMAADRYEFLTAHGCLDCCHYTGRGWLTSCLYPQCDTSYKGGRT